MHCTLDAEMKSLHAQGLRTVVKQAQPITLADEERLWESGILGDHSPQALLDANGIHVWVVFHTEKWSEKQVCEWIK